MKVMIQSLAAYSFSNQINGNSMLLSICHYHKKHKNWHTWHDILDWSENN